MKEQIKHSRDRLRIRSPFVRTDSSRSYPDFTIVDADTGITWYWEHLGMLGASEYDEKWVAKQPWHRTNGILHESEGGPNGTPVTTTEREGIDYAQIARLIKKIKNGG
jgi:hypothetical protein